MKGMTVIFLMTFLFSFAAHAAMYEWTDNNGVVNFTDNPEKIPAKYLKRVKKRPSITVRETAAPAEKVQEQVTPAADAVAQKSAKLFAGHDEAWWRYRYSSIRNELKELRDGLPDKKNELIGLRRMMTIHQSGRDRKAYYDKMAEIEKDEAREKELTEQLNALDVDAAKAGIPTEWRQ
jgi:hypothetical protein